MYKSVCIHKIILVHVADVTYPWLTTSAKQYQDPCFGSLMDSVNYQQCFLNFSLNLITVANPGEGPTPSYFWTKKIVLGDCHPLIWGSGWPLPPPPPHPRLSQCLDPATGLANWIFYQANRGADSNPATQLGLRTRISAPAHRWT